MAKPLPKIPASYQRLAGEAGINIQELSDTYTTSMRELTFAHLLLKEAIGDKVHGIIHARVDVSVRATYGEGPIPDMNLLETRIDGDCIGKMAEYLARKMAALTDKRYDELKTEAGL